MKLTPKLLLSTGFYLLAGTVTLFAENMTPHAFVEKTSQALDNRQNYSFKAIVVNHLSDSSNRHEVTVKVNRPNQLRVDVKGDIRNRNTYINNGHYTVYDTDKNMYLGLETPKDLDKALDNLFDKFGIKSPLAQLVYTNMGNRIIFEHSKNFGIVDLAGESCHYLAFSDKNKEVHVWISTGETPLVKHYRIIDKTDNSYQSISVHWNDDYRVQDKDFIFTVPKMAEQVFIK